MCWSVLDVLRARWNLIFIGVERNCGSLFVGAVIAFADNSELIDNSRQLVDNVRDKL